MGEFDLYIVAYHHRHGQDLMLFRVAKGVELTEDFVIEVINEGGEWEGAGTEADRDDEFIEICHVPEYEIVTLEKED